MEYDELYDPILASRLKTVKQRVEWILDKYPSARANDTLLVFIYLRKFYGIQISYVEWQKLRSISVESITRMRRKLQEEGKYLPDDDVLNRRRTAEKSYRHTIKRV